MKGIEHLLQQVTTEANQAIHHLEIMKERLQNYQVVARITKTGQMKVTDEKEVVREKIEGADQGIIREVVQKSINEEVKVLEEDPEKHPDENLLLKIIQGRLALLLHPKQKVTNPVDPLPQKI